VEGFRPWFLGWFSLLSDNSVLSAWVITHAESLPEISSVVMSMLASKSPWSVSVTICRRCWYRRWIRR
jgi:Ca2+/Na+ antiporter